MGLIERRLRPVSEIVRLVGGDEFGGPRGADCRIECGARRLLPREVAVGKPNGLPICRDRARFRVR